MYGLAADIRSDAAIRRVYAIKGRPTDHPLIVHLPRAGDLARYALQPSPAARALAEHFWPGPLTIVVRKAAAVPYAVTGGQETVALRVVDHALTTAIIRALGGAVAAPSANRFGQISPTDARHVLDDLGDEVDLIVDGGPSRVGVESTIVDLTGDVPAILRSGAIGAADVAKVLKTAVVTRSGGTVRAPGMLVSHYAPRARLAIVDPTAIEARIAELTARGEHVARLTLPDDPAAAARTLYASLRALDGDDVTTIVVALPPDVEANAAVRDRLTRAAAPR